MKRAATHRRIGRAGAALLAGISALLGLGACQYLAGRDVVRGTLIDGGSGDGAGGGTGGSGGGMAAPIDYACAWVKDFGEEVDSKVALALDSAGAVIVAGGYRGNIDFGGGAIAAGDPAAHDVFIAKLGGAMGEYKWAAGFGDDGSTQIAQMIAATSDSIFVAGTYQGVLNAPGACGAVPMAGDDDAFLLKLTPEGDCVAGTTYGFEMSKDHAAAMAASETDVMLLPSCHDESEMHVVRYDTNLSQLDHCAFVDPIPMMPAVLHIHPRAASIAGQNVYFAGGFNGTMVPCTKSNSVFNQSFASSEDAFVGAVAIQNIGGLVDPSLWTFNWGDQVTQSFSAIAADPGGAIVMAGAMEGTMNFGATVLSASPGGKDALIAQVSLNGTPGWALRYGNFADQSGEAVAIDGKASQVAFAGNFLGTISVGGDTFINPGGYSAIFLAKLRATDGSHVFSRAYGDGMLGGQSVSAIAVDPKDGGLVLAGTYAGKLDFGGECAALVNGDALRRHLFVVKLLPKKVEPDGG